MIAHRGGGSIAPENTLAGLKAAASMGYRAVEFDVMLAADGEPVLMHDETLGRTVAGRGRVSDLSSADLFAMDAGAWMDIHFRGEPVPHYRSALDFCLDEGLWMNVEIKPARGHEAMTGETVARLTRQWLGEDAAAQVLFSSFSVEALQAAQAAAPDIPRGWLRDVLPADWPQTAQALAVRSLHLNRRLLQADVVTKVHAAGLGLFCYTVNAPAELQRLGRLGVDAICTDRIDLFSAEAMAAFPR